MLTVPCRYGWRSVKGELVPVPAEQAALARMKALAAQGTSTRQIALVLTAEGPPHETRRSVVRSNGRTNTAARQHERHRRVSGYIAPRRHRPGLNIADGRNGVVYSSFSEWGFYGNGQAVRVLPPDDPYAGRVGTVQRTFLEGGELVHVVRVPR